MNATNHFIKFEETDTTNIRPSSMKITRYDHLYYMMNYCQECKANTKHNRLPPQIDFGYTPCHECGTVNEYEL